MDTTADIGEKQSAKLDTETVAPFPGSPDVDVRLFKLVYVVK